MRHRRYAAGIALFVGVLPLSGAEPINPQKFSALHTLIRPTADEEKWNEIPWLSSLWDARKKAAADGKPILLWEMDGHPLGCV